MRADRDEEARPVDLAPLDPTAGSGFDATVRSVIEASRFELARRTAASRIVADPFGAVPRLWGRVAWPAAAAVALLSLALLRTGGTVIGATPEEAMAIAVGVPEALAPWVDEPVAPGLGAILVGWEGEPE